MSLQERNIKKYADELAQKWNPDGTRKRRDNMPSFAFDPFREENMRVAAAANGYFREVADRVFGKPRGAI